jgi:putative transposase
MTHDQSFVGVVRKLRTDYPRYSAAKLAVILRRDFDMAYSAATVGRVIRRFGLYFSRVIRRQRARKASVRAWIKRKPYELKATKPHQVIEFDMKHIRFEDRKWYAFVAVDILTKEAVIHVATSSSSLQAKLALKQAVERFGRGICVVNDNGSENFDKAYAYLQEEQVIQYFARPHTPKDKPHVENLIGKLQQECLDEYRDFTDVTSLQSQVNRWLNDYHFFRPHQALHYQTPEEFCATMGLTIPRAEVSMM